jgi:hypothetical protein
LLQRSKEGDDNKVTIAFFILFCCNTTKKVTGALLSLPSSFSFVAAQQRR